MIKERTYTSKQGTKVTVRKIGNMVSIFVLPRKHSLYYVPIPLDLEQSKELIKMFKEKD